MLRPRWFVPPTKHFRKSGTQTKTRAPKPLKSCELSTLPTRFCPMPRRELSTTARSRRPMPHGLRTRRTGNQHAHIPPEPSRHPTPPSVNPSRSRDGHLRSIGTLSSVRKRARSANSACSAKTACLPSVRPWASWSLSCMSRISSPLRTGNPCHVRNRGIAMQRSRNRPSDSV